MRLSSLAVSAAALPGVLAWGGFGHITVAYIASNFVSSGTTSYLQTLLRNDTGDYLAGVATWADSARYSKWFRWTGGFHYIDAKDNPPTYCGIDYERDCKKDAGCVVSALHNYTTRLLDTELAPYERAIAAKFVIHFIGDIHQPLHTEDVERGGNGIHVTFDGVNFNLHHVWDTSIAEKLVGGIHRKPYPYAKKWADELTNEIKVGKYSSGQVEWLKNANISDPISTALAWAVEGNALVCTTVLPEGAEAIRNQELGSDYYEKAAPVVEAQIAKAGYRLAAWLDLIVSALKAQSAPASADGPGDL
ncbi:putative nuclease S1 precursor [Cladorrhinum sp. PSN332]|nr:putative nuclease S1 precursor [Cladorrhinum sp. PSN332]